MRLETTYLNERIELLEVLYGPDRHDQLRSLSSLYNRLLGPVTSINLLRPELLDLSIYSAACGHSPIASIIRDLVLKDAPSTSSLAGGGKGVTMLSALLGTLGEVAERFLSAIDFQAEFERLEYATYDQLVRQGRRALGPEEMPLFAAEQYASPKFDYLPFRSDTLLGWLPASELLTGDPILVPAQLVLMYYKLHPDESPIGYATSAGLAFNTSRRRAILHALYEVSERDGVNVHWYSRIAPPRVDVDLNDLLATHCNLRSARMSTPYVEAQFFLNTLDTPVPVFTAIALDHSREDRAFLGGGAASSRREDALIKALVEMGQSQTAFRFEDPFGRKPVYADTKISELTEFLDAPLYYGYATNLPRLSWYVTSPQVIPWDSVPTLQFNNEEEEYEATMDWVRAAKLKPIVLDFTGACGPGMWITKVLVPQLTQACAPADPILGHPRFYELPKQLGRADRVLEFRDLNSEPLPLP